KVKETQQEHNSALDEAKKAVLKKGQNTNRARVEDRDLADRNERLQGLSKLASKIRQIQPDETDRDKKFETDRYLTGLARFALGDEELDRYPSPFKGNNRPPEIRAAADEYLTGRIRAASQSPPQRHQGERLDVYQERRQRWQDETQQAKKTLQEIGL